MSTRPFARQTDNCLTVRVNAIEPLGSKADVWLSTDQHPRIVARLDWPVELTPGRVTQVYVDVERVHYFDWDDANDERGGNRDAP